MSRAILWGLALLGIGLAACDSQPTSPPGGPPPPPVTALVNRETGLMQGSLLAAFHDAQGRDWVGGGSGAVLSRSGGGTWMAEQVGLPEYITGIWGTSTGELFATVGDQLRRRDGAAWTPVAVPTGGAFLLAIGGLDDTHAWIGGSGGLILYRDGDDWKRATVPVSEEIWGVAARSPEDVVAVGQNGVILQSTDGGRRWVTVPSPTTATLFAVAVAPNGRMVAVGVGGTVLLRDGDTWERSVAPTTTDLFEVAAAGANHFLVAGNSGLLLEGDGLTWHQVPVAGSRQNLRAIAGPPGHRIVAGWSGTVLDEATGWGTSVTSARIYDVDASPDGDAIAVGEGGAAYHRRDGDWEPMAVSSPASLYGIDGPRATDRIAVGDSGTILHFDGTAWRPEASGATGLLRSVWWDGAHGMIVGEQGTVLVRDGGGWHAIASGTTRFLRRVGGDAWNRLWIVGDSGMLLRWNGERLSRLRVGTEVNLRGVYERSADDVWVVGDSGTIRHLDRWGWRTVASPTLEDIRAVHGIGPDLYIAGAGGVVYGLRDSSWTAIPSDQSGFWLDLDGRHTLLVVGENGMVAEGAR